MFGEIIENTFKIWVFKCEDALFLSREIGVTFYFLLLSFFFFFYCVDKYKRGHIIHEKETLF